MSHSGTEMLLLRSAVVVVALRAVDCSCSSSSHGGRVCVEHGGVGGEVRRLGLILVVNLLLSVLRLHHGRLLASRNISVVREAARVHCRGGTCGSWKWIGRVEGRMHRRRLSCSGRTSLLLSWWVFLCEFRVDLGILLHNWRLRFGFWLRRRLFLLALRRRTERSGTFGVLVEHDRGVSYEAACGSRSPEAMHSPQIRPSPPLGRWTPPDSEAVPV